MFTNEALTLQSERLYSRPFSSTDARFISHILRDPIIIFWYKKRMSWRLLRYGIRNSVKMNKWVLGWWLIFSKKDKNTLIGVLPLQPLDVTNDIEIGYHSQRDQWGKGYATKAAERLLEHAFTSVGLREICAVALPYNPRSISVTDKLGLTLNKNTLHQDLAHRYFTLNRDDHLARRQASS
ncbi:MAG: GNAT family N-acetyltransferase [bacterium]|nr:GNAT family N-acetyltransferase [bacterium]